MRALLSIFSFCYLTLVPIASFGQEKSLNSVFYTTGSYSGLTLTLKADQTFTLKYRDHISSDTAAGIYRIEGDTISLRYDYNNYETIFASYQEHNKEVPIDIQLAASRVVLRPKKLIKKNSKFYVVDEATEHPKRYDKNSKTHWISLRRAK